MTTGEIGSRGVVEVKGEETRLKARATAVEEVARAERQRLISPGGRSALGA